MTYRYDPTTGTMHATSPRRASWWRRIFARPRDRKRPRRAITSAQAAQLVVFRSAETGAERL